MESCLIINLIIKIMDAGIITAIAMSIIMLIFFVVLYFESKSLKYNKKQKNMKKIID